MAASIRSSTRVYPTTGTSTAVTKPTGTVSGDYLVAFAFCDNDGSLAALTAPTGTGGGAWSELSNSGGTAGTPGGFGKVFAAAATGSEPSSYTFGHPNAATVAAVCIELYAITGHNTSTPLAVTPVWSRVSPASTTSLVAPTVTMSAAGLLMCRYHLMGTPGAATITPAAGMTGTSSQKSDFFLTMLTATQSVASGATGTKTATSTNAGNTSVQGYLTVSMGVQDLAATDATVSAATVAGVGAVGAVIRTGPVQPGVVTALAGVGGVAIPQKTELLTDNYATADSGKWSNYGGGPSVVSGQLQIVPTTGYPSTTSVDTALDFSGSYVLIELVSPPNVGNGTTQAFISRVQLDGSNYVQWFWGNGTLVADRITAGVSTNPYSAAYDPVAHRWLRMRESGGTVFWDTSSDGLSWTNRGSTAVAWDVTRVAIYQGVGYYGVEPSPGTLILDNFNLAPTPNATPATVAGVGGVGAVVASGGTGATAVASTVAAVAAVNPAGLSSLIKPATVAGAATVGSPVLSSLAKPATVAGIAGVGVPSILRTALATPATVAGVAAIGDPNVGSSTKPLPATVAGLAGVGTASVTTGGGAVIVASTVAAQTGVGGAQVSLPRTVSVATVAGTTAIAAPVVTTTSTASVSAFTVSAVVSVATPTVLSGAAASVPAVTVPAVGSVATPAVSSGSAAAVAPSTVSAVSSFDSAIVVRTANATPTTVVGSATVGTASPTAGNVVQAARVQAVAGVGSPVVSAAVSTTASATTVTSVLVVPSPIVMTTGRAPGPTVTAIAAVSGTATAGAIAHPGSLTASASIPTATVQADAKITAAQAVMARVGVALPRVLTVVPVVLPPKGGWYSLLDIYREASEMMQEDMAAPPVACPNDGEPLLSGPHGELYCPFDGWMAGV